MEIIIFLCLLAIVIILSVPTEPEDDLYHNYKNNKCDGRHHWMTRNIDANSYIVCDKCKLLGNSEEEQYEEKERP